MFYEKLQKLAKEKGKSFAQIEKDLGMAKNSMYNYKKNNPTATRLNEIAEYFNVSTDYLLGNTDSKKSIKEPVDLEDLTSDDDINWDEWLSFGGKPISDHDKQKIKEIFGDRLKG
ncbi:helix-turn-helix domain-containing protein [Lactococcus taiwanensis]|uniref:Helix-turn-helix domain-containing protein n=1 Tax=Lactococcus taiwanensis TaxID=1151742 RepID=A0AA45KG89_9LACT|nr:helix-turn-helix domain-containing protein [Lactococcus taiwanensis]QSE76704.1 helix-turn-helix domain-containing protein [Lactococcus taiwanensis]